MRRRNSTRDAWDDDGELDETLSVDLHGLAPERALRHLSQGLHGARLRGAREVLVITGRGWGNREQKPVLRLKVEEWLRGPDGARFGVESFETRSRGGALLVRLRVPERS